MASFFENKQTNSLFRHKFEETQRLEKIQKETTERTVLTKEQRNRLKEEINTQLRNYYGQRLLTEYKDPEFLEQVHEAIGHFILQKGINISEYEKNEIGKEIFDDILGFGKLQDFIENDEITEIMVIGPGQPVYIEDQGKLVPTNVVFDTDEEIQTIINKIVAPIGRRIDKLSPRVDARLPDGSRVHAIIPPIALDGSALTIRKFGDKVFTPEDYLRFGSGSLKMFDFLQKAVISRLNIVVSGGTGSGKTTLLNALSTYIPDDERIVTIEDSAELKIQQAHKVRLEARPANSEGMGEYTIRDGVRDCLRMRPDRIIVGECRGGEALDMLQAMNTGHDGSLTTGHANTPKDMLSRLETMVLMSGTELPVSAIRQQISGAVDLIVQLQRFKDGSRKIISITEVVGLGNEAKGLLRLKEVDKDKIYLNDIFRFKQTGVVNGKIVGEYVPVHPPTKVLLEKFSNFNIEFPENYFTTP